MKELTERQAQVYHFVRQRIESGFPPTLREMADCFGFRSTMAAASHVSALVRKGYLRRSDGLARGLSLAEPNGAEVAIGKALSVRPSPRRGDIGAVVAAARAFVAERPFADVALTNAVRDLDGDVA